MQPFYFIPRDRFFCTRCSFYAIGFSPFSSTLDCSATTNQDHLTESTPHFAPNTSHSLSLSFSLFLSLSLSPSFPPSRSKTHTPTHTYTLIYTYNRVPFTPALPPFFSLSLSFYSRLFGFGPSRHPGSLRSLTNLFDKSFRLIGWTTRPLSFF